MGGTSHYVVRKQDHPGSSYQEIRDEPDWGKRQSHRVGFRNHDDRIPGYTHEARGKYLALREREARGELVNFRDVINAQEDFHLVFPEDHPLGWRYVIRCTEDWVKYGQKWPANEKAKREADEKEKKQQQQQDESKGQRKPGSDEESKQSDKQQHADPKDNLTLEEAALLKGLQHEKDYIANLEINTGNRPSPQRHNRTDVFIDEADQFTPDNWLPRCPSLIRLTGKHPLNAEAPLTQLFNAGLITPNELHYVRNHGAVPKLLWEVHTVEVDVGSENGPKQFSMDELKYDFRSINIPVFFACDGNRRKELNVMRRSKGFNWGPAAGGCAYWKGPLLRDMLLAAGLGDEETVDREGVRETRRWVNFEGSDDLAEGKYATCIPLAYAMDERNDVLLAYEMNDLPLPPDHGYPVRVLIPGYVGGRCVKWLRRIWISDSENDSYYHVWDNRVLPSFVTDMEGPITETLFQHPDTACNEQNLNSIIVRPQQGERIYLRDAATRPRATNPGESADEYRIEGFAYDGGGHEVQRVEVSLDDGASWLYCIRRFPDAPIRHGKKFWTWCFWHVDVPLPKLVQARSIAVRCFNVFKNTQPPEPAWNLMGMMNNAWYTVKSEIITPSPDSGVSSCSDSSSNASEGEGSYVLFRHPVEPGTGDGGWMRPSVTNEIEAAKREAGTPQKQFTREEVEKHRSEDDCWIVVDGKVYDATSVLSWHPGGKTPITAHAGRLHQETTDEFSSIHDDFAYDKLKECLLGVITDKAANFVKNDAQHKAEERAKSMANTKVTLQKHRWVPATLLARKPLSEDTRLYRFELPDRKAILGLSTCEHVQLGFHLEDRMVIRSYTPTRPIFPPPENAPEVLPPDKGRGDADNRDDDGADTSYRDGDGTFELVVKTYFPTSEQPGGAMSNLLDCMPLGERVEIRGPIGDIEYRGNSLFVVDGAQRTFNRVSLVLGGSGVTPGYALMARIVLAGSGEDKTEVRVVDANKREEDILLRAEIDELEDRSGGRMKVAHVVSHPSDGWQGLRGLVNEETLRGNLFGPGEGSAVFVCGPPAMMQKAVIPALKAWGYREDEDIFGF